MIQVVISLLLFFCIGYFVGFLIVKSVYAVTKRRDAKLRFVKRGLAHSKIEEGWNYYTIENGKGTNKRIAGVALTREPKVEAVLHPYGLRDKYQVPTRLFVFPIGIWVDDYYIRHGDIKPYLLDSPLEDSKKIYNCVFNETELFMWDGHDLQELIYEGKYGFESTEFQTAYNLIWQNTYTLHEVFLTLGDILLEHTEILLDSIVNEGRAGRSDQYQSAYRKIMYNYAGQNYAGQDLTHNPLEVKVMRKFLRYTSLQKRLKRVLWPW